MSISPNYFSPLEFQVTIDRLPSVQFFIQQSSIPAISSAPVKVPSRLNAIYQQGDEVDFSNLELTFILDEKLLNYTEIFDWIIGSNFPNTHKQFNELNDSSFGLYSDISILIMNSKKNPHIRLTYKDCFPISLSDVSLNTTESDVVYPQATAIFQYDTFAIERVNK
jgi:hypothetical protein